jgi:SAM-dependent methyltransferase
MNGEHNLNLQGQEENNWWDLGRRDVIQKLLIRKDRGLKILEIGGTNGALLLDLKRLGFYDLHGVSSSTTTVEAFKQKGIDNAYLMNELAPALEKESFDIIISTHALEYLQDDILALKNWNALLKQNGELYIFVPAFNYLLNQSDAAASYFKRYTAVELKSKLESAAFTVEDLSYWNFLFYFPATLYTIFQKVRSGFKKNKLPADPAKNLKPKTNKFLLNVLKNENMVFKSIGLPVGTGAYAKGVKQRS